MVKIRCLSGHSADRALTVVDVNTRKECGKKEMQENFLRVNKEAAEEIAQTTAAAESLGNGSGGFYKSDIKIRGRGTA